MLVEGGATMMDWNLIISTAVGFITAFTTKVGEEFAKKAGEQLLLLVKNKFKNDKEGQSVLSNFKKKPARYRGALTDIIKEKVETDPKFGAAIRSLVEKDLGNFNRSMQIASGSGIAQAAGPNSSAKVTQGGKE